jgi:photosystem II stability/assembly factor-like uncharacterized protein
LVGVDFSDASTGFAVGDLGTILRTKNGGASWATQASGALNLEDVSVAGPNVATAVGAGGLVLRTTDGGAHWVSQSSGTGADLWVWR